MGTIAKTEDNLSIGQLNNLVTIITWANLGSSDDGAPVGGSGWADKSIQVEGTFGSGGTIVLEGSNDGTNYRTLNDPFGVQLSLTSAGIHAITEATKFIRPRVTAGDGTTAITATVLVRRAVQ